MKIILNRNRFRRKQADFDEGKLVVGEQSKAFERGETAKRKEPVVESSLLLSHSRFSVLTIPSLTLHLPPFTLLPFVIVIHRILSPFTLPPLVVHPPSSRRSNLQSPSSRRSPSLLSHTVDHGETRTTIFAVQIWWVSSDMAPPTMAKREI
ncbi:hypothetical protein BVRB_6g152550 [Beta vulgaris subsp. vulgaris]|nr:hypothetical protein BVRB_6g152550 [Beta vulgaris subsp. vulgaris]